MALVPQFTTDTVADPITMNKLANAVNENASTIESIQGKIINSNGSNANGEWIKFENGTLICNGGNQLRTTYTAAGRLDWVFPASFNSSNFSLALTCGTTLYLLHRADAGAATYAGVLVKNTSGVSVGTGISAYIDLVAIGRWK